MAWRYPLAYFNARTRRKKSRFSLFLSGSRQFLHGNLLILWFSTVFFYLSVMFNFNRYFANAFIDSWIEWRLWSSWWQRTLHRWRISKRWRRTHCVSIIIGWSRRRWRNGLFWIGAQWHFNDWAWRTLWNEIILVLRSKYTLMNWPRWFFRHFPRFNVYSNFFTICSFSLAFRWMSISFLLIECLSLACDWMFLSFTYLMKTRCKFFYRLSRIFLFLSCSLSPNALFFLSKHTQTP